MAEVSRFDPNLVDSGIFLLYKLFISRDTVGSSLFLIHIHESESSTLIRDPISPAMDSPRRSRNRAACRRCQRRKIRCDGDLPRCASCTKANAACVNDGKQEVNRTYVLSSASSPRYSRSCFFITSKLTADQVHCESTKASTVVRILSEGTRSNCPARGWPAIRPVRYLTTRAHGGKHST